MNKSDLLKLALKNFTRRKTRSILTILGVVVGTASIVVMISLGIGMNVSYQEQLKSMGSLNVITVSPYYFQDYGNGMGMSKETKLDDEAVAKIAQIDGVQAVTPYLQASFKLVSGKLVLYADAYGIDPSTMEDFDFKVESGRLLTNEDTTGLVFGSEVPYMFYNPKANNRGRGMFFYYGMGGDEDRPAPDVDVLNDKLELTFDMNYGERRSAYELSTQESTKPAKLYKVKGVGLLQKSQNYDNAYSVYMNINYLKKLKNDYLKSLSSSERRYQQDTDTYQQVKVKVKNMKDVQKVQKEINEMGYGASSLADILNSMEETSNTMQAVLGGIGAISLFVAALGITNTMIMSIYERTREIGVMKVLGCLLGDIRGMFLIEAGIIGFMGGVVGILLSYLASYLLNFFARNGLGGGIIGGGPSGTISVIPVWLSAAALGFATFVGLISGFMPARRAMKLSALEAIKTE
jgi:ABC-type antimicrobial peptide transport system permease subunit